VGCIYIGKKKWFDSRENGWESAVTALRVLGILGEENMNT
jgi:hypothetical protein